MALVDTSLYEQQLMAMRMASQAFELASADLDAADEYNDKVAYDMAQQAIKEAREAWRIAAQEVGQRVYSQVEMIEGRHA